MFRAGTYTRVSARTTETRTGWTRHVECEEGVAQRVESDSREIPIRVVCVCEKKKKVSGVSTYGRETIVLSFLHTHAQELRRRSSLCGFRFPPAIRDATIIIPKGIQTRARTHTHTRDIINVIQYTSAQTPPPPPRHYAPAGDAARFVTFNPPPPSRRTRNNTVVVVVVVNG